VEQVPNRENTYRITSAGFKGLLNSDDPSAINDEYLYDMRNLMVDAGVLHTVNKALDGGVVKKTPTGDAIHSCQINQQGLCYVQGSQMVLPSGGFGAGGPHAVRPVFYAGKVYSMAWGQGLYADDALLTKPFASITQSGEYNACAAYNGRLYAAKGPYLRFSEGGKDASLDAAWEGENEFNIIRMVDGGCIHYLFPTRAGLLIIMAGIAYMLSDPWTGSMRVYNAGGSMPTRVYKSSQPYCDGSTLYYCCSDGMYALSEGQTQRISSAIWPGFNIAAYNVGEYMGRLWFLVSGSTIIGADAEVTYLYALDKATGGWEKYDLGFDMTGVAPTSITAISAYGNGDRVDGIDGLLIGTSNGGIYKWMYSKAASSAAPWGFTTKSYVLDESVNIRPVSMRLTYRGSAAGNTMTIKTLIDGVDCGTKTYALDAGNYVHFSEFELPTHKPYGGTANAGNLGKVVQLEITGTNPIEISRISLNAKARSKGEESRIASV
jgi:hypothetical protein